MEYIIRAGARSRWPSSAALCMRRLRLDSCSRPRCDSHLSTVLFPGIRSHAPQITAKRGDYAFYAAAYRFCGGNGLLAVAGPCPGFSGNRTRMPRSGGRSLCFGQGPLHEQFLCCLAWPDVSVDTSVRSRIHLCIFFSLATERQAPASNLGKRQFLLAGSSPVLRKVLGR